MSSQEVAQKWNMSERRVRILCMQKRIPGAVLSGYQWKIPVDAVKPADGRLKKAENLIDAIELKKTRLASFRPLTAGEEDRLAEEFCVESAFNSAAMGGGSLTLRETDMALRGLTVGGKSLREYAEAAGYRDAFVFVRTAAKENRPLTEDIVKRINALLLADKEEDRGVYRRIPVRIPGAKTVPVPPALIAAKMKRAIGDYQNGAGHILFRLALFHLEFETIFPFIDGNGRTGRLLTNFELMKAGYPPIDISPADKTAYYNAFDDYAAKGAASAMENLFARCLNASLDARLRTSGAE